MEKILSVFVMFIAFCGMVSGQSSVKLFSLSDSVIGTSYVTSQDIIATRYYTPEKIFHWHWDGITNNMLLELRESNRKGTSFKNGGTLYMIDLDIKDIKWKREVNYNTSEVKQFGAYYFLSDKRENSSLDPETGNLLWKNKCDFYFVEASLNIGIGYPVQSMSNKLMAVDLSNGETLWSKKIDRKYGWDDAYMLNDSLLLISVNGIHVLNLTNGNGWTYKANTVKKEYGKMIGTNVLGLLLGIFTGFYFYQTDADVVSNMVSNMLIDPYGNVLLASREHISRIDKSGNILWSRSLPHELTSTSSLFKVDSVVYMVNRGCAQYNGNLSDIGDPYLAAYTLDNGKRLYFTEIPEKKDYVRNYQVINDLLFLVFEDKVVSYSLGNGRYMKERSFELQKEEQLDGFVGSDIYFKQNDNVFKELATDFYNYNLLMTTDGRIFVLTDSLETLITYDKEELFHKTIDNSRYTLITSNDSDFVVLDKSNVSLATFKALPEMFLKCDALYFFDHDSFWEVNLDQVQIEPSIWQSIFQRLSGFIPVTIPPK